MKIEPQKFILAVWETISDVPGWPDAPFHRRVRQALPVVIPFFAALGVILTHWMYVDRARDNVRATHEELLWIEEEIADLHASLSDERARELQAQEEAATAGVLATADDATPWLRQLVGKVAEEGWRASFRTYDNSLETPDTNAAFGYVPALAKLEPLRDNDNRVTTLANSLGRITQSGKRIDLTRMVIRADVPERPQVEINLRLPHLLANAETAK